MRMKRLSMLLLVLALVFTASLAVVGCGGGTASFTITNLVISPTSAQTGDNVEISATVTNSGGASGSYTATLTVNGTSAGTQTVTVAAGASTTVSFNYSLINTGTLTVAIGGQSDSLTVSESTGYWSVNYKVAPGSYLVMSYSAGGITPQKKTIYFNNSDATLTMLFNKSVVNGAREVKILESSWVWPHFIIKGMLTGIDAGFDLTIDYDAVGTLYVQDGIGDVDITSVSTSGTDPIQVDNYGDGTKDPAGSMAIPIPLVGNFDSSVGQGGSLAFTLVFTTGHSSNLIHITIRPKMNGAIISSDEGVTFAKDGGPAPYVGTAGTIVATGTGECLGIKLVGLSIDFQYLQVIKLEPAQ